RSRTTSDHLQPTMSSNMRAASGGSRATSFFRTAIDLHQKVRKAPVRADYCRTAFAARFSRVPPSGATCEEAMKKTTIVLVASLGSLACGMTLFGAEDARVPYPEGYRDWTHVKSMVIQPGHPLYESFGGIHHLYANDAAIKGYQSGKFPDGAVIIFDLLEA